MDNTWNQLRRKITACSKCKAIVETMSKPILGVGSLDAGVLVVGLAPGKDGAGLTGIPFTRDPSGELVDEMLTSAGLSRGQDVFITNLVKCNPKDSQGRNRPPSRLEIQNCLPYLQCEISCTKPQIIVTLGKAATEILLGTKITRMGQIHGKIESRKGVLYFPFIHPAYVIRGAYDKNKYLREFKVLGDSFRNLIKQESRLSRLDILLLLIKKGSERGSNGLVRGKTRLQKLLFLAQDELGKRGYKAKYAFRPYLHGPYSRELYTDIEWLKMNNLIEVKTSFWDDVGFITDFAITERGRSRLMDLIDSHVYRIVDEILDVVIAKYGKLSIAQLVEFVHRDFSGYHQPVSRGDEGSNVKLDYFIHEESERRCDKKQSLDGEI